MTEVEERAIEEHAPGYIEARAECARDAIEGVGGRVTGYTWRHYDRRREKGELLFEIPADAQGAPVRVYGVSGLLTIGERGADGFFQGKLCLDPQKGEVLPGDPCGSRASQ